MKRIPILFPICLSLAALLSQGAEAPMTAADLAAKLSGLQQNGTSFLRLKMEIQQPPGTKAVVLQLQIKQRRTPALTEIVYQVLWPRERKGEAVLLRKAINEAPSCLVFQPPNNVRALDAAQMKQGIFGSDLSYADVTENFYEWKFQALVGSEVVNRVNCHVLESKPGKEDHSAFAVVRSWVDVEHMIPMRVEKILASGTVGRRIDTTKTSSDGGQRVPANLTVKSSKADSLTLLEGSSIKHGMAFDRLTFTDEGLKDLNGP